MSKFRFMHLWSLLVAVSFSVCHASNQAIGIGAPATAPLGASLPVDHSFASFSFPAHWFADYAGNSTQPNLFSRDILDLLREKSGVAPYIRVGGTSADHTFYNLSQEISVTESNFNENGIPNNVTIGPVWFEGFTNFPGSKWIFQVNIQNTIDNAINEARSAMNYTGKDLIAFEIGNEPDISALLGEDKKYNQSQYVEDWLTYADAISEKVLKGNPYGLDETTFFQALTYADHDEYGFSVRGAFADGIAKSGHVKAVSQHQYAAGNESWVRLQNSFMNHTAIAANLSQYQSDMQFLNRNYPNVTYVLGETNSDSFNLNMAQIEGVFGSALWMIDYLMYGMTQNITRMHLIQGTTFGYTGWVPVPYNGRDPYVRPPLYGQIVAADVLGHDPFIQIQEVELDLWNFSAYAVYESQKLAKFVIVNLDEWNNTTPYHRPSREVLLNVPLESGIKSAVVERLVGNGANADEGITWGGVSWNYTDGRLVQGGKHSVNQLSFDRSGQATLTVSSSEAVLVTLRTVSPGPDRHVYSDVSILHGQPPEVKTGAQLSLEETLQGSSSNQALAQPGQAKPGQLAGHPKLRDTKPRLLLMGLRRSGKSSISSVVFHKMPPTETLFLESTTRIQKDSIHSFMDFQVWDFPGQLEYLEPSFDLEDIFGSLGALVWVIDAQDDYLDSVARLNRTILTVQQYYPNINIEVFIHKVDGLSDEYRTDTFQDIVQRISDELSDAGYENAPVHYYLTSIYDYSVFEAFSKVIQKLIPQLSTLENLINILVNNCGFEKTYLFDVLSKIYIASDTRPVDMSCYEMCSDYIDVIVDISELYSWDHPDRKPKGDQMREAESHVMLHDGSMIHLMEMNKYLCLVSVIRNPEAAEKKGLIDMNCRTFQNALNEVFSRSWEQDGEGEAAQEE
ncbi:GTP-binding protein GTR2 [Paecilomyces variotii No. 5]|uniref:GTP-binding protein GTR2 n=1 Tax=Byssochlamys spectabilis (strain No. 5 / NBRC 109023) TaxID=1356009 RepID=V5GAW0_BYSSN|nr:GTP-binding protein GTR2 [Paecilomyces variotii No. 5]